MNLASKSMLLVSPDVEVLKKHAHDMAKKFKSADVFWLTGDTIQVKETNEFMALAHLAPVGENKLMIICDASTMTPAAQNKTLKPVEDSVGRTTFLFLATNPENVLITVKSRCVTRYLPLPDVKIAAIDGKDLNPRQRYDILNTIAIINRNIGYNCNAQNQQDLLYMELLKCEKQ